jgi:GNAT superfamily N-acetyltransferase
VSVQEGVNLRWEISERPIRRLTATDLTAIVELAADRGWSPEESKWRLMFAVSEPYDVDDPEGGLAGVVVLTRYGPLLATVGMMLVASRHARRGLGRRLMQHALAQAGRDSVVYLTATELGRPLYERLGFRAIDTSVTYRGRLAVGQDALAALGQAREVTADDLAQIAAADRTVFGADRSRLLAELIRFAGGFQMIDSSPPGTGGYSAAWANDGTMMIGPVVAPDASSAARLVTTMAGKWPGPIRLDILGRHKDFADWAVRHGLSRGETTTLMTFRGDLPGDRAKLFCPVSVAIG